MAHKENCRCRYHQRQRQLPKKLEKCLTQPSQDSLSPGRDLLQGVLAMDSGRELQFESWKGELSAEDVKKYYFEYLKTLPSFTKFKRHDKLDCHNTAFEEFLRNHYLVILDRMDRHAREELPKTPHRTLQKVYTEGNIDERSSERREGRERREFLIGREADNSEGLSSREGRSGREASRYKKLGFKGTGKDLDLIEEGGL